MPKQIFLTAAPLLSYVDALGGTGNLPLPHVDRHDILAMKRAHTAARVQFFRLRAMGKVDLFSADRICVDLIGVHPCEVYGMEWFEVDDVSCPILWESPHSKSRVYAEGIAA